MSDVQLSGDAVDALNKILAHAQTTGGVVGISGMGGDDWSVGYTSGEESTYAVADELEEAVIGVAKQAGLI